MVVPSSSSNQTQFSRVRSAFDPSGQLLCVAGRDGRVRVYDVLQRRLRVECHDARRAAKVTALAFAPAATPADASALLAVGYANGNTALWSLATASIVAVLNSHASVASVAAADASFAASSAVLALAWAPHRADRLVASLADGSMAVWARAAPASATGTGASTGASSGASSGAGDASHWTLLARHRTVGRGAASMTALTASTYATAGLAVRLVAARAAADDPEDVTLESLPKLPARHSAPVTTLCAARGAEDRGVVASANGTERQLYLWQCAEQGSRLVAGFNADAPAVFVDCAAISTPSSSGTSSSESKNSSSSSNSTMIGLLSVTGTGTVDVWVQRLDARTSTRAAVPHCRIASENLALAASKAFAARFVDASHVLVARGNPAVLPRFDVVAIRAADTDARLLSTVTLPAAADTLDVADVTAATALPGEGAKKRKKGAAADANTVDVLAPHEAGAIVSIKEAETAAEDNEEDDDIAEAAAVAALDKGAGERLQERGKRARRAAGALTVEERVAMEEGAGIRADSMHTALMQAIRTNDQALLDTCLYSGAAEGRALRRGGSDVLTNTVRRLPPQYVVPFLTATVDRFQSTPGQGLVLVQWIRAVLAEHLSYLMTVPNIVTTLSGLYLAVHARLESHKSILKLSGRLDLVLAQIARQGKRADGEASVYAAAAAAPPLNVITEDSDGEPQNQEFVDPAADDDDDDMRDEEVRGPASRAALDDDEDEDDDDLDDDEDEEEDDDEEDDDSALDDDLDEEALDKIRL